VQEYDVALKLLLRSRLLSVRELVGTAINTWIDAEMPKIQNLQADLLTELEGVSVPVLDAPSLEDLLA
jgi:hypothetical protein